MAHVNRRFTSGLFGTQTAGWLTPFRGCPPVCTPVLWVKRAVGAVCVLVLTVGSVVVGSSSSLSMTERGAPAGAVSLAPVTDTTVLISSRGESHDWTPAPQPGLSRQATGDLGGYTVADLRLANVHFKPSLVPWALETSYCESRNEDGRVGESGERGRWQIHPLWVLNDWTPEVQEIHRRIRRLGYEPTVANLAIPEVNATVANYIVTEFGPSLWTTGKGCEAW